MSLSFAFAYAAGEGPQLPTTPLMMHQQPNAPNAPNKLRKAEPRERGNIAKRRLTKDRWLATSDGELIGRIQRIVRRPDGRYRFFMQHMRHKDIVEFDGNLGKCDETDEVVRVCKDMMM